MDIDIDNQTHKVMRDGEKFKKWLTESKISVTELAEKLGVSRQNIYENQRKDIIDGGFLAKLKLAGYDIFSENSGAPAPDKKHDIFESLKNDNTMKDLISEMRRTIEAHTATIEAQRELISLLKEKSRHEGRDSGDSSKKVSGGGI